MKKRAHIWRQWVAMLCVALMAVLFFQEADATEHAFADAAAQHEVSLGDGVFMHVHQDAAVDDDHLPPHEDAAPHAHQCLCVHTANVPAGPGVGLFQQLGVSVAFTSLGGGPLVHRLYALERPPRLAAAV